MHVFIAVPAYTGQVHLGTMRALLTDILALQARGDSVTLYDESGSAMIADARAQMLAEFRLSEADHLVMVDSDVAWEAGGLLRLVDHPVECVAAIYPCREDPIRFPYRPLADSKTQEGLLEIEAAPAGFLRCSRNMIEQMVSAYPETEYVSDKHPGRSAHALFESVRANGKKLSEDYSFCHRWRATGGQIWADPSIAMAHIGDKVFMGRLADTLRGE